MNPTGTEERSSASTQSRLSKPLRTFHRALTHGQEHQAAARTRNQWETHFLDARGDSEVDGRSYARDICSSGASHVLWRLTQQSTSALSVGVLISVIGMFAGFMALINGEFPHRVNAYLTLAGVMLGLTLITCPRRQPRWAMVPSLAVFSLAFVAYATALSRLGRSPSLEFYSAIAMAVFSLVLLTGQFLYRSALTWLGFAGMGITAGLFAVVGLGWFDRAETMLELTITAVLAVTAGSAGVMLFRLRRLLEDDRGLLQTPHVEPGSQQV